MENLDLLKNTWQNENHHFPQISENEIYKILQKKSSSIVKLLLIISILEVFVWTMISVFFNSEDYVSDLKLNNWNLVFSILDVLSYTMIVVFLYLFYSNYKRISVADSTKTLMVNILKTRKTVQYYVGFNLVMIVFVTICSFIIAFQFNPEVIAFEVKFADKKALIAAYIAILVGITAIIFVVFWLFYKLLYGILTKRLWANYKELEKIKDE